jgi:hypothetical protein
MKYFLSKRLDKNLSAIKRWFLLANRSITPVTIITAKSTAKLTAKAKTIDEDTKPDEEIKIQILTN